MKVIFVHYITTQCKLCITISCCYMLRCGTWKYKNAKVGVALGSRVAKSSAVITYTP